MRRREKGEEAAVRKYILESQLKTARVQAKGGNNRKKRKDEKHFIPKNVNDMEVT